MPPMAHGLRVFSFKFTAKRACRAMLRQIATLIFIAGLSASPVAAQNANEISRVQNGSSCTGCNLFQAEMSYKDVQKIDLSQSRLRQSNLALGTFDDVDFSGANLSVANLFGARFNRSNFTRADLQSVTAVGTYFGASNFTGADLTNGNFSGADLSIAKGLTQGQLNRACGDSSTLLPKGTTIPRCRRTK